VLIRVVAGKESNSGNANSSIGLWHHLYTGVFATTPPILEQFRTTFLGRMPIGTTFSWWDSLYYALGYLLGYFWLRQLEVRGYMQKRFKVKPNSKYQSIKEETDGSFTVHLKSPPVDGKANKELIKRLSENFNVAKSKIRIKSGLSSRQKLIEIDL
jgi:uncharacterized protein (TIGR00251 family)